MDLCDSLSKLSILKFHTKYWKELKGNYDQADPLFDAWMTITWKQRPEFDVQMFKLKIYHHATFIHSYNINIRSRFSVFFHLPFLETPLLWLIFNKLMYNFRFHDNPDETEDEVTSSFEFFTTQIIFQGS